MITLNNNLDPIVLGDNPAIQRFVTNSMINIEGASSVAMVAITGSVSENDTFNLNFDGNIIQFTAVNTPDDSGVQVHTYDGVSDHNTYIDLLASDIRRNYLLGTNYDITGYQWGVTYLVLLIAKEVGVKYEITTAVSNQDINAVSSFAGLDTDTRENFEIRVDVLVEEEYGSDSFEKVASTAITPNKQQIADYDFSPIISAYPETHLPTVGSSSVIVASKMVKRFKYRYAEAWGVPLSVRALTESDIYYTLPGALSKEAFAQESFYNDFLVNQKRFLCSRLPTKELSTEQDEFLYFMLTTPTTLLHIKGRLHYTDGTAEIVTIHGVADTEENNIYIIPVGYQIVKQKLDRFKTLESYDVWVYDYWGGSIISEEKSYTIKPKNENSKYFYFKNSFGAIEVLHLDGESSTGMAISKKYAQRYLGFDFELHEAETKTSLAIGTDEYTVNSGFKSKGEIENLSTMLLSKETWELKDGKLWPVIFDVKKLSLHGSDGKDLPNLTMKYRSAYTNKSKGK